MQLTRHIRRTFCRCSVVGVRIVPLCHLIKAIFTNKINVVAELLIGRAVICINAGNLHFHRLAVHRDRDIVGHMYAGKIMSFDPGLDPRPCVRVLCNLQSENARQVAPGINAVIVLHDKLESVVHGSEPVFALLCHFLELCLQSVEIFGQSHGSGLCLDSNLERIVYGCEVFLRNRRGRQAVVRRQIVGHVCDRDRVEHGLRVCVQFINRINTDFIHIIAGVKRRI